MSKILFSAITFSKIAIHFKTQKELEDIVDYLKNLGYQYGTGKSNDMDAIKDLGVHYFGKEEERWISLDRSKKYCSNNFCSCGKGFDAVQYEYKDIEWGQVKESNNELTDGIWNISLSETNENNCIVTKNNPTKSGKYLCTCVQTYNRKEVSRYLQIMEYDADKTYWHDCGNKNGISHNILAWTDKIKPCEFSDYEYGSGGLFMEPKSEINNDVEEMDR